MSKLYRKDLAHVHDRGFTHFAAAAADLVVDELRRNGVRSGTVVELGCGSGVAAATFHDHGYDVVGVDLSSRMIELARELVPAATFHVGSFLSLEIPPCVAVTAIGEVFNYAFDAANGDAARGKLFGRIHEALAPGGILLFDSAGPDRAPADGTRKTYFEGEDWTVLVESAGDEANGVLTRRMVTFRELDGLYRRDVETHYLQLVDPRRLKEQLRGIGFTVEVLDDYGGQPLPPGLTGFRARKSDQTETL